MQNSVVLPAGDMRQQLQAELARTIPTRMLNGEPCYNFNGLCASTGVNPKQQLRKIRQRGAAWVNQLGRSKHLKVSCLRQWINTLSTFTLRRWAARPQSTTSMWTPIQPPVPTVAAAPPAAAPSVPPLSQLIQPPQQIPWIDRINAAVADHTVRLAADGASIQRIADEAAELRTRVSNWQNRPAPVDVTLSNRLQNVDSSLSGRISMLESRMQQLCDNFNATLAIMSGRPTVSHALTAETIVPEHVTGFISVIDGLGMIATPGEGGQRYRAFYRLMYSSALGEIPPRREENVARLRSLTRAQLLLCYNWLYSFVNQYLITAALRQTENAQTTVTVPAVQEAVAGGITRAAVADAIANPPA